jgi:dolichol-phosphate mannosyltransferase
VVDDNSPDRTWEAVEEAFAGSRQVRVLRRLGPRGLPAALAEGVASTKGEVVVWLDADGSMPAAALPRLLDALEGADVAVASRYALGGQDARRSPLRTVASRVVNGLGTLWLGGPVRDWTSGFVAARRTTMLRLPLSPRHAHGEYCIDFLYRARRAGLRLVEVPYRFVDRRAGETKTSPDLRSFARLGLRYLVTIARLPWVSRREGPGS